MSEWQDISTAPKDGSSVLLYEYDQEGIDLGCLLMRIGFWMYQDPWKGDCYWSDYDDYSKVIDKPTHWMPLPPAPLNPK